MYPDYNYSHVTEEKKLLFPRIPKEFGEDGGKFYKHYDDLAEEMDPDLVHSLKAQLDGILIFSGLFAGVNSAFLALTLPQLTANPVDDTNALLSQLVKGYNNSTQQIDDLPSASFSPPPTICSINGLFSTSLTLALLSSFLAVLGQQWLVQYRKRTGGGAEHQRWEQLRRYLGAERWHLEFILGHALPSLLQISLIVFCIAFVFFLRTLNSAISWAVAALMILVAAIVLGFAISAAWDQWCPFKSPLSQLLQITLLPSFLFLGHATAMGIRVGLKTSKRVQRFMQARILPFTNPRQRVRHEDVSLEETVKSSHKISRAVLAWFRTHSSRPADQIGDLKASAIKRLICTSEDSEALVQVAINLQAYKDPEGLRSLLQDDDFHNRLCDLFRTSYRESGESMVRAVETEVFGNAFLYVILSVGSIDDFCLREGSVALTRRTRQQMSSQLAAEGKKFIHLASQNGTRPVSQHYLELALWARMIGTLVAPSERDDLPMAYQYAFENLSYQIVKILCLTAWGIVVSKEWVSLKDQNQETQDRWCVEKARRAVELYRQAENVNLVCQMILDAVATSDSDWEGRPSAKEYGELLSMTHFWSYDNPYKGGIILRSWGTLLLSVEKMIRDPKVTSDDREKLREQRKEYFRQHNDQDCSFKLDNSEVFDIWREAQTSLFDFLDWLKEAFEKDPTTTENLLVLKLLQEILDAMPSGEQPSWATPETWKGFTHVRSAFARSMAVLESIIKVDGSPPTDEVP